MLSKAKAAAHVTSSLLSDLYINQPTTSAKSVLRRRVPVMGSLILKSAVSSTSSSSGFGSGSQTSDNPASTSESESESLGTLV